MKVNLHCQPVKIEMNVTEQTYNAIWQLMLDVARLERYYDRLRDRYLTKHQVNRYALLFFAGLEMFAVTSHLMTGDSDWLVLAALVSAMIIVIIIAVEFASQSPRKLGILQAIATEVHSASSELNALWLSIPSITESDAVGHVSRLEKRLTKATSLAGLVNIRVDNKLNIECERDAYRVMEQKYAA